MKRYEVLALNKIGTWYFAFACYATKKSAINKINATKERLPTMKFRIIDTKKQEVVYEC